METDERYKLGVDVANDNNGQSVLSVWKGKELRYSIFVDMLRANYLWYMQQLKCSPAELMEDVAKYGELAVMMHDCWELECQYPIDEKATAHLQHFNSGSAWGNGVSVTADRNLTDEEKFICALIECDACDYGLTSKMLGKMYGWSTYKARKVAHGIRHKYVGTLISEDREGYFGKGWLMERTMHTLISDYERTVLESRKSKA